MARILCIHNQEIMLWGLRSALEGFGHEVVIATTKQQAYDMLDHHQYHIVICGPDFEQKGDGVIFAEELRDRQLKIIFMHDTPGTKHPEGVWLAPVSVSPERLNEIVREIHGRLA